MTRHAATPIWLMPGKKAFVDLQHDVTTDDIALAHREGFRAVEHMKRYTTHGMATDQGKSGGVLGMAMMALLTGRSMADTGTTLHRPPYTPVAIGALAGAHRGKDFRPTRLTPGHDWAAEQGASFVESGPWLRAQWFPRAGETDWLQSVSREVLAVRNGVGVCDVSTLGKIELVGPDAGALLDFVYANTMSTLPVGPRALRHHAARGRLRARRRHRGAAGAGSLRGDDHHRQCAARAGAHGVRASGAVAGAARRLRLRHRPLGAVRDRRAARARGGAGAARRRA